MLTIKAIIKNATCQLHNSSDSPNLDAELLLAFVLGKTRSYLRGWNEQTLTPAQIKQFQDLLMRRKQGQPIAYLIGYREFWSRNFIVTPDVLIPRPETELLIELALVAIPTNQPYKILDLGTGSGIIAITLASERPLATVIATDISQKALNIARSNAERLQINNLQFFLSDWLQLLDDNAYDMIISNPPYIAPDDPHLSLGDISYEPTIALVSAQQGLQAISVIAEQAREYIKSGGLLYIEHGYCQQQQVQNILKNLHYENIQSLSDLSGNPRVTYAQSPQLYTPKTKQEYQ